MAVTAKDMDEFLPLLSTTDTKMKLTLANKLIAYLADPENSIECSNIGQFVDNLVPWMQSSNNKVSQNGIDAMTYLVDRMGVDFRPYLTTVLPPIIDRLGDSKEMVREKAQLLILKLMERDVISPQGLFDRLTPAFSYKNGKIREEVMNCLQTTLTEHGAQSLSVSKLVPHVVKLLSDPMSTVRDTAFNTLVEIYRHVGERLRMDLHRKHNIPASKLPALMARFNELKATGDLLPSAVTAEPLKAAEDEPDNVTSPTKRASSVPRRGVFSATKSVPTTPGSSQAGAVDEESFCRAFEDVPTVQLFSAKELEENLTKIREIIADPNKDWSKRVEALKKVRSLLIAGAANFEELTVHLRLMESAFQTSVKDLRSQVVREACYTIAFLAEQLKNKLDHFAEFLITSLVNLIQNSAKVMASAGVVTLRFILRHVHAPRLVPAITQHLTSKSREIRRSICELLELLLHCWPRHSLERHIALLQDAIRRGIADADPEARLCARKAFWSFRSHFPEQADSLLSSLDSSYKRALNGDLTLSNSSSSNSLHHQSGSTRYGASGTIPKIRQTSSATDSIGTPRRISASAGVSLRSNSAIDLQAAQRAKARAQYAALARHKVGSGASLPRPKKTEVAGSMSVSAITSPERTGRTRSRTSGVSQSQPSSRSGSPSSRLSYATYSPARQDTNHSIGRPRMLSGIPRSTGTSREASRETSPNRFGSKLRGRGTMNISGEHPPQSARPVLAQKILQQSREAESALADAFNYDSVDNGDFSRATTTRKLFSPFGDHSDDSETSSVCSERSFDSYRRPSDSYSWSGSQQRLYRDMLEPASKDVSEMIVACASMHWADRKEGLVGLQNYFQNGNVLTGSELKRVTEIFTKMFTDSHTKVFSLFLDTLKELIITHKADLHDWLYVLLTRLLNKLGADLLGSIQNKIHTCLLFIRDSFPCELQLQAVMRFMADPTQTPNSKVKVVTANFVTQLSRVTAQCELLSHNNSPSGKDPCAAALTKLINWAHDTKSAEVRRAAHTAVISLYNLNVPQMTLILSSLPSEVQDAGASLIQSHIRGVSSSGGGGGSPPSPSVTSTSSPRLQSPGTPQPRSLRGLDPEDDSLNPEEVYRSLRRTTAEIQNYSFEGKLERDRDTTSQDSGISQMSAGGADRTEALEEALEGLSLTRNNSGPSSSLSSPTHRLHAVRDYNGLDISIDEVALEGENSFNAQENHRQENVESVRKIIETLKASEGEGTEAERKAALSQLIRIVREGSTQPVVEHFRTLLKVVLDQLARPEESVRALVFGALTEMLKKKSMVVCFQKFVELLVVKVLEAHRDSSKDVVRVAESCAATMATVLPPEVVVRVLTPLITAGDYPVNMGAIKMLTRLVEHRSKDVVEPHLATVMPGLIKAYDSEESPVRKSAVFCMVALHSSVGEATLQPHLQALSGSKLKLLHLYIRRAQQGSSAPTSPKNAPP